MKVIKRNGTEVEFNIEKIILAINKANNEVDENKRISDDTIKNIAAGIRRNAMLSKHLYNVEEIQNLVEKELMKVNAYELAQKYIKYRYKRSLARKANTTDEKILSLIECTNEEIKQENSNKNPTICSVQRDYMAGEVSRDLTERLILPEDVVKAHKEGIIHFHDSDYFAQTMHNCCLVNLEDMLQNGTVISGTMIEKPKSFTTACNIATQIIAQIASSQYGGQSISLSHLAPFVDVSRKKFKIEVRKEFESAGIEVDEERINKITELRIKDEIKKGVQMIQYQVITLMTTNGQAPFVTVFMYLNEVPEGQVRDDLAKIIEEMLNQRILGVKNEKGIYITPAFPKLIYVLAENNIEENSKYWYLTQLAAKCSAKRLVPDYISERVMKQLKGDIYPCMGCVDGKEVITYKFNDNLYTESFERMWNRLSDYYEVLIQPNGQDEYMNTDGIEIYDHKKGFVKNYRIIRNKSDNWNLVKFKNGRSILCTTNHPFDTKNRGVVQASELNNEDIVAIDKQSNFENKEINFSIDKAWMYGFMICDSSYAGIINASVAIKGEEEIIDKLTNIFSEHYNLDTNVILQHRGLKGEYKDIRPISDKKGTLPYLVNCFQKQFEGIQKMNRHIPNEVFSWNRKSKLAFLAGIIDADGYINSSSGAPIVQIGSTNKEFSIQQMLLAQSLGFSASVYLNKYNKAKQSKIRYRVEFVINEELLSYIQCQKKKNNYIKDYVNKKDLVEVTSVVSVQPVERSAYSYDVTTESEHFTVSGIYSHNCRSFLTPDSFTDKNIGNIAKAGNYNPKEHKYYGRFNQGVVTINLPDVALSSKGSVDDFWKIFDERLELCHKALQCRHKRLKGTLSDVAPVLWQYGALARLEKGETIDKLLFDGYSTISLGYAGLYECTKYMTGDSHTGKGKDFALSVMKHMNDKCDEWKNDENIAYSLYGTPLESTTYKFAKCLQNRFGIIKGITDKNYITNSYHVHVTECIDAFSKLKFEAEFQALSPGGAISYIEVPNMQDNLPAVLQIMKFIYDNITYAELNTKSDYCDVCGYDGEIKIVEDSDDKLVWECPNCKNRDQNKMSVARRTCGYIGTQFWNQGRTQEIKDRFVHVSLSKDL